MSGLNRRELPVLMRVPEVEDDGEFFLAGIVEIFGQWFHMSCYLVDPDREASGGERRAHPDMPPERQEQLEDAWCALEPDACFEVTKVPGFEGEYIIIITPFCE